MNHAELFSLRTNFIDTEQALNTRKRIIEVHSDVLASRTSKGLLLVGPSGGGKTTLIKDCVSNIFSKNDVPGKKRTALVVNMPSSPSKRSLASAILAALGDPFAGSRAHSAEVMFQRVTELLSNLGVELLIIDETQHLVDYKRVSAYDAGDWIKDLMNKLKFAVILVGLERTEILLRTNEQLRRRFSARVDYDRYRDDCDESYGQFARLILALQGILPVETIDLTANDTLLRLYFACHGLIDYLMKLLDRAVSLVNSGECDGIDLQTLERSFVDEVWRHTPTTRNPFHIDFDFKPLIGAGEPFENMDREVH